MPKIIEVLEKATFGTSPVTNILYLFTPIKDGTSFVKREITDKEKEFLKDYLNKKGN